MRERGAPLGGQRVIEGILGRRSIKASIACIVLCISIVMALSICSGSWASSNIRTDYVERIWKLMGEDREFDMALEEVGALKLSSKNIPKWMLEEILDESWLDGSISNSEMDVLWLSRQGDESTVEGELEAALKRNGWMLASSNGLESMILTFMKMEGERRWILAELMQSGAETIAVLHIERS